MAVREKPAGGQEQGAIASTLEPKKLTARCLANAIQVHPKVISGGLPEGDAAFQELVDLGVKTIVSVDGAKPDVDSAKRFGLRYAHLPHGYDGISDSRGKELAKAVRDLPGTIYIHCHHGKHRSPAAASVACVTAGLIPSSNALSVLQLAGTSPNYQGLYHAAENADPLDGALLNALQVEFRESVDVPPMAEAMVALEQTHERLERIAKAGWRTPADHPDLEPAHEALLLSEQFAELLRTDDVQQRSKEFRQLLIESETAARGLETALRNWNPDAKTAPETLSQFAGQITSICKRCHQAYRDVSFAQ